MHAVISHADARAIPIFRYQADHSNIILHLDIAEVAVVSVQEYPHWTTAIVDNEGVIAYLCSHGPGDHCQPALVIFQRSTDGSHSQGQWLSCSRLQHLDHLRFEEFDLRVTVVNANRTHHAHFG